MNRWCQIHQTVRMSLISHEALASMIFLLLLKLIPQASISTIFSNIGRCLGDWKEHSAPASRILLCASKRTLWTQGILLLVIGHPWCQKQSFGCSVSNRYDRAEQIWLTDLESGKQGSGNLGKWMLGDMTAFFKYLKGCQMQARIYVVAKKHRTTSNGLKLKEQRFGLNIRRNFWIAIAVWQWNWLSRKTMGFNSLEIFEQRLNRHLFKML